MVNSTNWKSIYFHMVNFTCKQQKERPWKFLPEPFSSILIQPARLEEFGSEFPRFGNRFCCLEHWEESRDNVLNNNLYLFLPVVNQWNDLPFDKTDRASRVCHGILPFVPNIESCFITDMNQGNALAIFTNRRIIETGMNCTNCHENTSERQPLLTVSLRSVYHELIHAVKHYFKSFFLEVISRSMVNSTIWKSTVNPMVNFTINSPPIRCW